jgi:hypothetical protein
MQKHLFTLFVFSLTALSIFSQESILVEKLAVIPDYPRIPGKAGASSGPNCIMVDEILQDIEIPQGVYTGSRIVHYNDDKTYDIRDSKFVNTDEGIAVKFEPWVFEVGSRFIYVEKDEKIITYLTSDDVDCGHSFILKDKDNYIIFFVNRYGQVGALDVTGKTYRGKKVIEMLQQIDPEKYQMSLNRARQLGLEEKFIRGDALVWGQTYYSSVDIIEGYWKKLTYPLGSFQIQYDLQGNGYQGYFVNKEAEDSSEIWIVDPNGNNLKTIGIAPYSEILNTYVPGHYFTYSLYTGFGGNIYYFVSGDEFTEVFRIRRTWGTPDPYAMAVNGYTEDGYGAYVKQALAGMNRDELRLLRNYLFAIYGYEFRDPWLRNYFEKQVWYRVQAGLTSENVPLSGARKRLLELVQEEERKR